MSADAPDSVRPLHPRLAGALVFYASGAVLVLEIVGLRLVGPYVGVTLQTSSAVIGVALAAIAYGAWSGGWIADRIDPRRVIGPALLAAAVTTAVTVPVVRWAGELLRGTEAGNVVLLAMLALFLPAALLSAVTPLVVKLQLDDLRVTGRVVGRLSSVGTLGAITATLGTGFVLVRALPTSVIVLVLAGLTAAIGGWLSVRFGLGLSRQGRAAMAVVGFSAAGLAAVAPTPCDVETAYHCARVTTDPARASGRVLWLNSARHSYVDLADPTHLEFAYAQWIAAVAAVRPPLDVLHLGGGGFTLPRYFEASARGPGGARTGPGPGGSGPAQAGPAHVAGAARAHRRRPGAAGARARRLARPADRGRLRAPGGAVAPGDRRADPGRAARPASGRGVRPERDRRAGTAVRAGRGRDGRRGVPARAGDRTGGGAGRAAAAPTS